VLYFLNFGRWTKPRTPVILSVIHHLQNPFDPVQSGIYSKYGVVEDHCHVQNEQHTDDVRFEVFTAVTMKNVVFRDIKTQFVLHRRHVTSPLQSAAD
jgi:hypothetical protein